MPGSDLEKDRARVGIQDWWAAKPKPFPPYTTQLLETEWRQRLISLRPPNAD